jgi:hypothetical protein
MDESDVPAMLSLLKRNAMHRSADLADRSEALGEADQLVSRQVQQEVELLKINSIQLFTNITENQQEEYQEFLERLNAINEYSRDTGSDQDHSVVYVRDPDIKGPMSAFGYSWLEEHLPKDRRDSLSLPDHIGNWGSGGEYTYEALNLVDGKRSVRDIRNWLTAELGPVEFSIVGQYLETLKQVGLLRVVER